MDVKVTEHEIEPTPPPKTYDVEFKGLTLDEFVILRTALSDGHIYRSQLKDKHLHTFRAMLDRGYSGTYELMLKHIGRVLGEQ